MGPSVTAAPENRKASLLLFPLSTTGFECLDTVKTHASPASSCCRHRPQHRAPGDSPPAGSPSLPHSPHFPEGSLGNGRGGRGRANMGSGRGARSPLSSHFFLRSGPLSTVLAAHTPREGLPGSCPHPGTGTTVMKISCLLMGLGSWPNPSSCGRSDHSQQGPVWAESAGARQ